MAFAQLRALKAKKSAGYLLGLFALIIAAMMMLAPNAALAQQAANETVSGEASADDGAAATQAAAGGELPGYSPMMPTPGKGMAVDKGYDFQDQYSDDGLYAHWMHNVLLMPIITVITLFVLGLMFWVIVRYRAKANPEPSRVTHNTVIEVVWTLVPVLILVGIAVPSIDLLARQYEPAPEGALTIKVTGYQWYWGYSYPDNGDMEIISNMMPEEEARAKGLPPQMAVDNRMVVPAGEPIRLLITAADVIHSFAVPSLWFKMDAVPGKLNEKVMTIREPGVYYGQCSELCGARHGYMPISIEALPRDKYEAWVRANGGTVAGDPPAASEAAGEEAASEDTANETAAAKASGAAG